MIGRREKMDCVFSLKCSFDSGVHVNSTPVSLSLNLCQTVIETCVALSVCIDVCIVHFVIVVSCDFVE